MKILAIDPGTTSSGVVVYCSQEKLVLWSTKALENNEVLALISKVGAGASTPLPSIVAVERVQAQGLAGNDVLKTAEWSARFVQSAECFGLPFRWHYRREVCRHLDVSGGKKDSQVRERCIELHGGDKSAAVGVKKSPGPLYGVSGHAWQALGLALLVADI